MTHAEPEFKRKDHRKDFATNESRFRNSVELKDKLQEIIAYSYGNFSEKPTFRFSMQDIIPTMLLVVFGFVAQTAAQNIKFNSVQEQNNYCVDTTKPSVYLRREQDNDSSQVHLRLSNNSSWAIMLRVDKLVNPSDAQELMLRDGRMVSGLSDSIKILPEYFIESPLIENRLIHHHWCTSLDVWIPSGQSVLFEVPLNDLPKLADIYLKYHYEWEQVADESEHCIKFRWRDPNLNR
jgi:hypothetical protein